MNKRNPISSLAGTVALGTVFALAGCGGGGSSSTEDATGTLSLAITDAPVDDAEQVWVQFTGVTVQPASGPAIDFDFDMPMDIDLLTLTGDNTTAVLSDAEVPAGEYDWILLRVNAEFDDVFDSYVVPEAGGMVELRVPSQQGLRLVSGFTVLAGGSASFVIDWDLRKGLTDPVGQQGYFLRPALRITDLAEYGTISGTVADGLTMDDETRPTMQVCANDPATSEGNLVYVYEGLDVDPVDIDGTEPDPITEAPVAPDDQAAGAYTYSATFLPPGDYTIAFTCQGLNEDPEAGDELAFAGAQNVTVVADETATADF